MRVCRKEGKKNPDVWVQVLSYLVNHTSSGDVDQSSPGGDRDGVSPDHGREDAGDLSSEEDEKGRMEGRWDDVRELLALIERDRILPPLRVSGCVFVDAQLRPSPFGWSLSMQRNRSVFNI